MKEINDSTFDMESKNGNKIIKFYGDWCAPCVQLSVEVDWLEEKFSNITFLNINAEKNNESALKASVRSLPTLLLLQDGKEIDRVIGSRNKETIYNLIKKSYK